ncbi:nucleoside 2-deoxyribosyltransferase [Acidisoma cellulosilytica]|uniref:Nucleoside 2-deoxyribosyltransferase n=1 Tax=Acidisoma cellulosilyticum TaxID=2802395 RepID=A0A963Z4M4_9PROT|nr:nucleoside 2-deoxyribosyltransferase [Acidisoma cellulosilyticum]MCB8882386.1 nucleoside 2-deoxyribosyltransferase [Acidisoma cellulosilyticum]
MHHPPMITAYLAGPDVFLPNAVAHAARKVAICAAYGIRGQPPLNEDLASLASMTSAEAGIAIFAKDLEMMEAADIIIANLTPFRGTSADSGTLVEIGWFLGRGRPIFGYSNTATLFQQRSVDYLRQMPDPLPDVTVEGFGLPDNLMIPGAVQAAGRPAMVLPEDGQDRPFDALDVFERCVAQAAKHLGLTS